MKHVDLPLVAESVLSKSRCQESLTGMIEGVMDLSVKDLMMREIEVSCALSCIVCKSTPDRPCLLQRRGADALEEIAAAKEKELDDGLAKACEGVAAAFKTLESGQLKSLEKNTAALGTAIDELGRAHKKRRTGPQLNI